MCRSFLIQKERDALIIVFLSDMFILLFYGFVYVTSKINVYTMTNGYTLYNTL